MNRGTVMLKNQIKFKVIFLDECTYNCRSVEEVYNVISTFHGSLIFANHIKSLCAKAKSGDRFEFKFDGLIIECE